MKKKIVVLSFIFIFLISLSIAQIGYDNPSLPKIESPVTTTTVTSGGSPGANVTSVSSGDSFVSASPTTGDVIISLTASATQWFYNQTIGAINYVNTVLPLNFTLLNNNINSVNTTTNLQNLLNSTGIYSTFNATYDLYAYNQTVMKNIFNQNLNTTSNVTFNNITVTKDIFINGVNVSQWLFNQSNIQFNFNQSNIQYNFNQSNILYNYNQTSAAISNIPAPWQASSGIIHNATANVRVGIGTSNPGWQLSLGTTLNNTKLALYDSGSASYGMGIQANQYRFHVASNNARFSFLNDSAGNNELFTILGTGNVGIGTSAPGQPLHLNSSGTTIQRIECNGNATFASIEFVRARLSSAGLGAGFIRAPCITDDNHGRLEIGVSTSLTGSSVYPNVPEWMRLTTATGSIDLARSLQANQSKNILNFYLYDSDGTEQIYSDIRTIIAENTTGSESADFRIANVQSGTLREMFRITPRNITMNGSLLFVDGQTNTVSINSNNRFNSTLFINGGGTTFTPQTFAPIGNSTLHLGSKSLAGINNYGSALTFSRIDTPGTKSAAIVAVQTTADVDEVGLAFFTHNSPATAPNLVEAMRIIDSGNVGIGATLPLALLHVNGTVILNGTRAAIGGNIDIQGGTATSTTGGTVIVAGGTGPAGGPVTIVGGTSAGGSDGGSITISGGTAPIGDVGGDVTIAGGVGGGGFGDIFIGNSNTDQLIFLGSDSNTVQVDLGDGSMCIGTGGCTPPTTDGRLFIEGATRLGSGTNTLDYAYNKVGPGAGFAHSAMNGTEDLHVTGDLDVDGVAYLAGGTAWTQGDIAERLATKKSRNNEVCNGDIACLKRTTGDDLDYGDLVCIDPTTDKAIMKCTTSNSRLAVGFITDTAVLHIEPSLVNGYPVSLAGIVTSKVSNENGNVMPGDLLVSASKPGYAMKNNNPAPGTVVGKAFDFCTKKECKIPVFVALS